MAVSHRRPCCVWWFSAGLGCGLVYNATLTITCQYFDKRRGLALGIVTTGTAALSATMHPATLWACGTGAPCTLLTFRFDKLGAWIVGGLVAVRPGWQGSDPGWSRPQFFEDNCLEKEFSNSVCIKIYIFLKKINSAALIIRDAPYIRPLNIRWP